MSRRFIASMVGFAIVLCLSCLSVQAHNYNNGYSYVTMKENTIDYELLLPFPMLLQYDTNGDQSLEDAELEAHKEAISAYVLEHLVLFNNEQRMDAEVVSVQTAVQKQTEDTVVRIVLAFHSPMFIGNVTIRYKLFIHDLDAGHQNYIQLYKEGHELAGHWVVEKDSEAVRYMPDGNAKFHPGQLGTYMAYGAQHIIRSLFAWLILLCIAASGRSVKETFASVSTASLYSLIGLTAADKLASKVPAAWLHDAVLIGLGAMLVYRWTRASKSSGRAVSALLGLAWGTGSSGLIGQLQLDHSFRMISLLLYASGGWLAWLGILYVLHIGSRQLAGPLLATGWNRGIGWFRKPVLILVFVAAWLGL
ncbi:hypothetical protein [Paenibacillus sp. OAS669]|uniref:hypothetical protein n=1 Tax=Paenibacillus sp. OAS669 TaxID=2663821 RepID=UPI001789E3F2|nr:hypothetical protein [Paenibacillus sp. OAS669]